VTRWLPRTERSAFDQPLAREPGAPEDAPLSEHGEKDVLDAQVLVLERLHLVLGAREELRQALRDERALRRCAGAAFTWGRRLRSCSSACSMVRGATPARLEPTRCETVLLREEGRARGARRRCPGGSGGWRYPPACCRASWTRVVILLGSTIAREGAHHRAPRQGRAAAGRSGGAGGSGVREGSPRQTAARPLVALGGGRRGRVHGAGAARCHARRPSLRPTSSKDLVPQGLRDVAQCRREARPVLLQTGRTRHTHPSAARGVRQTASDYYGRRACSMVPRAGARSECRTECPPA
jgi:hypothetical protein